jgi:endoglycosylceramidase
MGMRRWSLSQANAWMVLLGLLAAAALTASGAAARPGDGFARCDGHWIFDGEGRALVLRGVNVAATAKSPPFLPWQSRDDIVTLRELGFNCVRYLIVWEAVEPEPGVYDDAYLDQVAERLAWCREAGLKVILDMHQDLYSIKYGGDGAPEWACLDDGIPAQSPPGGSWFLVYFTPAVMRAFDNFWANTAGPGGVGIQDRFIAMWQHVAAYFHDDTNIVGYDILNEPWYGQYGAGIIPALAEATSAVLGPEVGAQLIDILFHPENASAAVQAMVEGLVAQDALFSVLDAASGGAQEFEETLLQPFYDRTIAAIRAVDPHHICFYEPAGMSGARLLTALDTPEDAEGQPFPNLVFAPHFYDFSVDFAFPYNGTASYIEQCLARAQAAGDRMGVPTWFGEWGVWDIPGVSDEVAHRQLLVAHHADAFDALLVGWAYWEYGDDFLAAPFMPILTRPYAEAIAGLPTAMETTGDTLTLAFTPQERRGETALWAPPAVDTDIEVAFDGKGHAKVRREPSGEVSVFVTPNAGACTMTLTCN